MRPGAGGPLVLVFFVVAFLALCSTGGLVAWCVARTGWPFAAGTVVFGVVIIWMSRVAAGSLPARVDVIAEWAASGLVGFLLRDHNDVPYL